MLPAVLMILAGDQAGSHRPISELTELSGEDVQTWISKREYESHAGNEIDVLGDNFQPDVQAKPESYYFGAEICSITSFRKILQDKVKIDEMRKDFPGQCIIMS